MHSLAVIATKGGVGKTTIAVHVAAAAQLHGWRSRVIDADPQQSALAWVERRRDTQSAQSETATVIDAVNGERQHLPDLLAQAEADGVQLVVIDTPPHQTADVSGAARVADLVLVPIKPGVFDLEAVGATIDMIDRTHAFAFGVINDVQATARALADEAERLVQEAGLRIAPVRLVNRVDYTLSVRDGLTAPETKPSGKHAAEITALWDWLQTQLPIAAAHKERRADEASADTPETGTSFDAFRRLAQRES